MRTFTLPIDKWTAETVEQVVQDKHQESQTVEFKRELPFSSPTHKVEVAKDLSAMANGSGGWIIYGIDEVPGPGGSKIAGSASPLVPGSTAPENPAQWIDDVVAGNVTPRLRFRVRDVPSGNGLYVVVQVDPMSDDLHMVGNRFYRRSELAARPMTEPEIRQAYSLITREQRDAERRIAEIVAQELIGVAPEGFLLGLIPHSFRELIDPGEVGVAHPALTHLSRHRLNVLSPYADGVQMVLGDFRLNIRRDGAVTVTFATISTWNPLETLRDLLDILAISRTIWPLAGILSRATLVFRSRFADELLAISSGPGWNTRNLSLTTAPSFDLSVRQDELHDSPLKVASTAMNRLFHAMGADQAPYFRADGALNERLQPDFSDQLRALSR